MQIACNSLRYPLFDSVLLCLSLSVSFDLLEMQTVIKQAICVNVLQMCCNYGNKQR